MSIEKSGYMVRMEVEDSSGDYTEYRIETGVFDDLDSAVAYVTQQLEEPLSYIVYTNWEILKVEPLSSDEIAYMEKATEKVLEALKREKVRATLHEQLNLANKKLNQLIRALSLMRLELTADEPYLNAAGKTRHRTAIEEQELAVAEAEAQVIQLETKIKDLK